MQRHFSNEIQISKKFYARLFHYSSKSSATTINLHAYVQQRYTFRVLQIIQMKLILLWVWAEWAVLGRAKTALKFKYEI